MLGRDVIEFGSNLKGPRKITDRILKRTPKPLPLGLSRKRQNPGAKFSGYNKV
jgi:hypothetical protein